MDEMRVQQSAYCNVSALRRDGCACLGEIRKNEMSNGDRFE